jgi:hypothetical protein
MRGGSGVEAMRDGVSHERERRGGARARPRTGPDGCSGPAPGRLYIAHGIPHDMGVFNTRKCTDSISIQATTGTAVATLCPLNFLKPQCGLTLRIDRETDHGVGDHGDTDMRHMLIFAV